MNQITWYQKHLKAKITKINKLIKTTIIVEELSYFSKPNIH